MAENPLLTALPPASDYLTYLTILEYNLTADQLPTLHTILQDTNLTANIGWDLVHLLLPLLPASRQCLLDVARLGNPREVVLKVTEILEAMGMDGDTGGIEEEDINRRGSPNSTESQIMRPSAEQMVGPVQEDPPRNGSPKLSKISRFIILLEMLSILHPRIQTKHPSRFLSTSLREILPIYLQLAENVEATDAVLNFVKAVSGGGRPKLPPRKSSAAIQTPEKPQIAPDPEGQVDSLGPDEPLLQTRLLQSFLTYVIDDYISLLPSVEDVPGLAWSCRLQEKLHPEKVIQGRETYLEKFTNNEKLRERDAIVGQIVALARDIRITPEELLSVVTKAEVESGSIHGDLPSSAADVRLSRTGSLLLLSATSAASVLWDVRTVMPAMKSFPEFAMILEHTIGDEPMNDIITGRASLADAVIFLGLFISNTSMYIPPEDDSTFTSTLQRLSLLSANTPSAILRFNAHTLTTKTLHSHPSGNTRLAFIQDTLQHCPYENLKTSAVGWLKDEILSADRGDNAESSDSALFTTPSTLSTLSASLFLDPRKLIPSPQDYSCFYAHYTFYLASLNLLYLLITSPSLFVSLDVKSLIETSDIRRQYLAPLKQISEDVQAQTDEHAEENMFGEMGLLDGMLEMIEEAMKEKEI